MSNENECLVVRHSSELSGSCPVYNNPYVGTFIHKDQDEITILKMDLYNKNKDGNYGYFNFISREDASEWKWYIEKVEFLDDGSFPILYITENEHTEPYLKVELYSSDKNSVTPLLYMSEDVYDLIEDAFDDLVLKR